MNERKLAGQLKWLKSWQLAVIAVLGIALGIIGLVSASHSDFLNIWWFVGAVIGGAGAGLAFGMITGIVDRKHHPERY